MFVLSLSIEPINEMVITSQECETTTFKYYCTYRTVTVTVNETGLKIRMGKASR